MVVGRDYSPLPPHLPGAAACKAVLLFSLFEVSESNPNKVPYLPGGVKLPSLEARIMCRELGGVVKDLETFKSDEDKDALMGNAPFGQSLGTPPRGMLYWVKFLYLWCKVLEIIIWKDYIYKKRQEHRKNWNYA